MRSDPVCTGLCNVFPLIPPDWPIVECRLYGRNVVVAKPGEKHIATLTGKKTQNLVAMLEAASEV